MLVFNIASFIPIVGFPPENDISFKVYGELRQHFSVESKFVKPVGHIPSWLPFLKKSLQKRRRIIQNRNYVDENYGLKVDFFPSSFPLINILFPRKIFIKQLEHQFYKKQLLNSFKAYKPDIIHAHSAFPDGFYAYQLWKKYQVPYILTIRGTYTERYEHPLVKNIMANANAITTPSNSLFQALKKNYPIELLPHGIDDFWFDKPDRNFSIQPLKLVTVSRLLEMKNIHVVLQAIAELKTENFSFQYAIVGDGPYRKTLETLVSHLNLSAEVSFYGWQNPTEIIKIYKEHDIFAMLSYPETFGRAYFEAAAQGLMVIGVNNTGAYGHLSDKEGYFIEPEVEQLKAILRDITKDDFISRTSLSQKKITSYKNAHILSRYYTILREACANSEKGNNNQ